MLAGRTARPLPVVGERSRLDVRADLIEAVEGAVSESHLAAALDRTGCAQLWVRPTRHDADLPAGIGTGAAAGPTVVVAGNRPSLRRLRPAAWAGETKLFIETPPPDSGPGARRWWPRPPGRAARDPTRTAVDATGTGLRPEAVRRLVRATHGCPAMAEQILRAAAGGMRSRLPGLLDRASGPDDLVITCVTDVLAGLDPQTRAAVTLAAHLGYAHESLAALSAVLDHVDRQPWWEPLEGGWYRVAQPWRRALQVWPPDPDLPVRAARLVGELEQIGAHTEAVEVALRVDLPDLAAQILADRAARTAPGEHAGIGRWLPELPTGITHRHGALARMAGAPSAEPPDAPDRAGRLGEAAEALIDGRIRYAEQLSAELGPRRRQPVDRGPAATAHRLQVVARQVRAARSGPARVGAILRAARFASWVVEEIAGPPQRGPTRAPQPPVHVRGPAADTAPVGGTAPQGPAAAGDPVLSVGLLGPIEVRVAGRPVDRWTGSLGRAVLARLACSHPRPVPRERLLATFWPDVPVKASRNRLNVTMHDLRGNLGAHGTAPFISYCAGSYAIGVDLVTDVHRVDEELRGVAELEQADPAAAAAGLERVLALHRGEFCEDCGYAEWALTERDYHQVRRLDCATRLARLRLRMGDEPAALDVCRWLLTQDRCHEEAHRMAMTAHARIGQSHLALRQFDRCRRDLAAELGMDPAPPTLALHEAIRRRERV